MQQDPNQAPVETGKRAMFAHPPWTVGIVLIFGVLSIISGFSNPIWFVLGGPCILVLLLYLYVRLTKR